MQYVKYLWLMRWFMPLQVWNWFQNRRYAIRARTTKAPGKVNVSPLSRDDSAIAKNVAQAPQPQHPQGPQPQAAPLG